ncbi:phage holin family protein [Mycobacterium sp. CSUR Q5927]|nr:phage holin family protein [Mycobacterium sp. CSUR Q5927]
MSKADRRNAKRASNRFAKADRNGVPHTLATIPLADPHALPADPSLGDLVKDATAQMSTLVRAEVELARAEITRDVKKGLTGSVFFIAALVVLFYSTFFFFFFLAEVIDIWLQDWAAYLIVFGVMLTFAVALALLGFLRVRRIRGPRQTIESVRETRDALRPDPARVHASGPHAVAAHDGKPTTDPSGW